MEYMAGTCDYHPIMDINSNNRLNFSKSIYIGDHVWCGQEIGILNLYLRV